jgi:serine/threonine protein kinase
MVDHLGSLPLGHLLHEYRIEGVLGRGGFGITYLATDTSLNRRVAIKEYFPREISSRADTLKVSPAKNKEERETFQWGLDRFLSEARTLAIFDDPNIIAVRRFFEANGTAYLVMDYCNGESLDEVIKKQGPLNQAQVISILSPLLKSLERIHQANFLHRDIKPANLFIREDGSPVLLDFGSARQQLSGHSHTVTSLATAGYAPLEQYSTSGKQGPGVDIYGLAATLYRAMTGDKPQDALDRVLHDQLNPLSARLLGKFDKQLLQGIDAAMGIRPESRPQKIGEWRELLGGAFMNGKQIDREEWDKSSTVLKPINSFSKSASSSAKKNLKVIFLVVAIVLSILVYSVVTIRMSKENSLPTKVVTITPTSVPAPAVQAIQAIKSEPKVEKAIPIPAKPSKNEAAQNTNTDVEKAIPIPAKPSKNEAAQNTKTDKDLIGRIMRIYRQNNYAEVEFAPYSDVRIGDRLVTKQGNIVKVETMNGTTGSIAPLGASQISDLIIGSELYSFPRNTSTVQSSNSSSNTGEILGRVSQIYPQYNYAEIELLKYGNIRVGDTVVINAEPFRVEKMSGLKGSVTPMGGAKVINIGVSQTVYATKPSY